MKIKITFHMLSCQEWLMFCFVVLCCVLLYCCALLCFVLCVSLCCVLLFLFCYVLCFVVLCVLTFKYTIIIINTLYTVYVRYNEFAKRTQLTLSPKAAEGRFNCPLEGSCAPMEDKVHLDQWNVAIKNSGHCRQVAITGNSITTPGIDIIISVFCFHS